MVSCANGSPTSSSRIVAHEGAAERPIGRAAVYLARFSYDVLPTNRQRAIDLIRQEVEAARKEGRTARLLVPLPRGQGGAALQFEVELASLDQLERVRHGGPGGGGGGVVEALRRSPL